MGIKKGFTLSEVLITLGIIGVVAAVTMPTLVGNYNKQSYVTKLREVHSQFSQSLSAYMSDNKADNLRDAKFRKNLSGFVSAYFKIAKNCGTVPGDCFADSYKNLQGTVSGVLNTACDGGSYVLTNGASLCVHSTSTNTCRNGELCATIQVDINGKSSPNTFGKDTFGFFIYDDGVIDDWRATKACRTSGSCGNGTSVAEQRNYSFATYCNSDTQHSTAGCFGKILNDDWKMNY